MNLEAHARETIDRRLTAAGWHVCDASQAHIRAVVCSFRDKLFTKSTPAASRLPTTMIFAFLSEA